MCWALGLGKKVATACVFPPTSHPGCWPTQWPPSGGLWHLVSSTVCPSSMAVRITPDPTPGRCKSPELESVVSSVSFRDVPVRNVCPPSGRTSHRLLSPSVGASGLLGAPRPSNLTQRGPGNPCANLVIKHGGTDHLDRTARASFWSLPPPSTALYSRASHSAHPWFRL